MTVDLLERGAAALTFVGGGTIVLWITDPGAPSPRPTKDIDVVIDATTPRAFHDFQSRLRARGFREDIESGVICRWLFEDGSDLILDAMPCAGKLLGFENPWQAAAMPHATRRRLPSGAEIRAITPPYLFATKLAAFGGRGAATTSAAATLKTSSCWLTEGRRSSQRSPKPAMTSADTWRPR